MGRDDVLKPVGEACGLQGLQASDERRASRSVPEEDRGPAFLGERGEPQHLLAGPVLRQGGLHDIADGRGCSGREDRHPFFGPIRRYGETHDQ